MALSIGILGTLVIERDDCRLGKVPKKARALLGYLAAQGGQAVSRERLADLLWPYQGSEQARHSLRNCLLELRKALGPSAVRYLVADFANCRIEDAVVDLDRFERLSRSPQRAELQAAAELYRGEFLADFDIDSEPFQEWLAAERDRTLALICEVLQRLTAAPGARRQRPRRGRSAQRHGRGSWVWPRGIWPRGQPRWPRPVRPRRARGDRGTAELALPVVEHRGGGGAAAQSDRRSRAAISGRSLH